ncbi:MAG: hypothetical protein HY543_05970, partial [Deltaproteobacteria bacterium]|nr:hypothetical protein [Deltaproteobacteria bacterium]
LQRLIALAPTHISAYQLTVEERTPLAAKVRGGEVSMPDEELLLSMWEVVEKQLHDAGYAAYEISNFARPGFSCRHNRNYWEYGDYLGLGPGACTFLKKESDSFVGTYPQAFAFRFQRARNLHHYLAGQLDTDYEDPIPTEKAMGEYAMLALRTADGISEARFAELFHRMPHEVFADQFTEWQRAGWLIAAQEAGCHWRFSHHGRRIANTLCAQLF